MKKAWLVLCIILLVCGTTACTNNPPDLYMTPGYGEGEYNKTKPPVIVLDNEKSEMEDEQQVTAKKPGIQDIDQDMYIIDGVNIRESNSTDSAILFSMEAGTKVRVNGKCENGWYRIMNQGREAYINSEFVSETMPVTKLAEAESATETKKAVDESTRSAEVSTEQTKSHISPDSSSEEIAATSVETEPQTVAETEPETAKPTLQMINTTTMTGVVTDIGIYGFSIRGKDKTVQQFSCPPDVTASMKEGGYVVVTYKTYADSGQKELVSVSGQ